MRKWLVALSLTTLPCTVPAAPVTYTVDPAHTFPYFEISHLGFSTQRGRFNSTTGKIIFDQENKTGAVKITIDAASIDTAHQKRDDHLRSPDFLNAAEFPEITYESNDVAVHDDGRATVRGMLTIMGVSRPVTLEVDHIKCGVNPMNKKELCGFNATATLRRSEFGVNYALPAIGDEIRVSLAVEAYKD